MNNKFYNSCEMVFLLLLSAFSINSISSEIKQMDFSEFNKKITAYAKWYETLNQDQQLLTQIYLDMAAGKDIEELPEGIKGIKSKRKVYLAKLSDKEKIELIQWYAKRLKYLDDLAEIKNIKRTSNIKSKL